MISLRSLNLAGVIVIALASCVGCGDDTKKVVSQQGQSCQKTADCADGLACFGGTCSPAELDIEPNQRECAAIQCEAPADCCSAAWTRNASCSLYEEYCSEDPTTYATYCQYAEGAQCVCTGNDFVCEENRCRQIQCQSPADCCADWSRPSSCDTYDYYCEQDPAVYASECELAAGPTCNCSDSNFDCVQNMCVTVASCTSASECASNHCVGSRCVQCEEDGDCSVEGAKCVDHSCQTPECESDAECPAFFKCEASECTEVGCSTDRECMVHENSYLAFCDKGAEPHPRCEVSCASDAECYEPNDPLRTCVHGRCVDPGCESDEECKILLAGALAVMPGARAICRDKQE